MTYSEQLRDPRWQRRRLEILNRAGFKCEDCGQEKFLHVHHSFYTRSLVLWEYDDESLKALCEDCHKVMADAQAELLKAVNHWSWEDISLLAFLIANLDGPDRKALWCLGRAFDEIVEAGIKARRAA